MTTAKQVERALRAEERKLDKANRGLHRFDPIQRSDATACNWTANFRCIASDTPMDTVRAALERVQAKYPEVTW